MWKCLKRIQRDDSRSKASSACRAANITLQFKRNVKGRVRQGKCQCFSRQSVRCDAPVMINNPPFWGFAVVVCRSRDELLRSSVEEVAQVLRTMFFPLFRSFHELNDARFYESIGQNT